jgi:hypothetical protein
MPQATLTIPNLHDIVEKGSYVESGYVKTYYIRHVAEEFYKWEVEVIGENYSFHVDASGSSMWEAKRKVKKALRQPRRSWFRGQ